MALGILERDPLITYPNFYLFQGNYNHLEPQCTGGLRIRTQLSIERRYLLKDAELTEVFDTLHK